MASHCWILIPLMANMASIKSMLEMASPTAFGRKIRKSQALDLQMSVTVVQASTVYCMLMCVCPPDWWHSQCSAVSQLLSLPLPQCWGSPPAAGSSFQLLCWTAPEHNTKWWWWQVFYMISWKRHVRCTHCSVAIGLKVYTNIELLGGVVKVLHSSLSAPHWYLSHMKMWVWT